MKRLLLYFVAMVILLAVAIKAGQLDTEPMLLTQYAEELGVYSETQKTEAFSWIRANRDKLGNIGANPDLVQKNYTILVYRGDSLLFWSNTKVLPRAKDLAAFKDKAGSFALRLPLGWFVLNQENLGSDRGLVLIPIRYHSDTRAGSGNGPFPANGGITAAVAISETKTAYPVQIDGKDLFWLGATGPVQAAWMQWIQLVFIGLALFLLMALVHRGALYLAKKYGMAAGLGLLAFAICALRRRQRLFGATRILLGRRPVFSK